MGKPLEPIPVYEPLRDIPVLLHIQDKQKQLVPFVPNKMQADYLPRKTRRNIILKARQMGFSVGELADNVLRTVFVPGTNYAIVSHDETLARNLLVDFVRPWLKQLETFGLCPTIGRSNENEITFPNIKSSIRILSSKGDSPGRGKTYHILHATEAAFWKDGGGIMAGLLAPRAGSSRNTRPPLAACLRTPTATPPTSPRSSSRGGLTPPTRPR